MRGFIMSVLLASVYGGAATAQTCMQPSEEQAFNVVALKSSLMVAALSCGDGEQYDAFMTQFQPFIMSKQRVMDSYFRRTNGLAGQAQEDNFVTLLANSQSQDSIAKGARYCASAATLFSQVGAFSTDTDVTSFVAANPEPTPLSTASCGTIDHRSHRRPGALTVAVVDHHEHHTQLAEADSPVTAQ